LREDNHFPPAHALSSYSSLPHNTAWISKVRYHYARAVKGPASTVPSIPGLRISARIAMQLCRSYWSWITWWWLKTDRDTVARQQGKDPALNFRISN